VHQSVLDWGAAKVAELELCKRYVLEVGGLNENGSLRGLFRGAYVSLDMRDGPGVDIVCSAHQMPFDDAIFEVVICTEMLEHDSAFWLSLAEIGRVLRPGGWLLLTARGNGFPHHAYPNDYYRFMPDVAEGLLALARCRAIETREDPEQSGIFALGVRE
jgi:SAM-dependent methyltransferase